MIPANIERDVFVSHIRQMRNTDYMKNFFKPFNTPKFLKDINKKRYWLLKLKLYRIFYYKYIR